MDKTLSEYFSRLDDHLKELGESDSSVEYAPHQRKPFNKIIEELNEIKSYLGWSDGRQDTDWYFD